MVGAGAAGAAATGAAFGLPGGLATGRGGSFEDSSRAVPRYGCVLGAEDGAAVEDEAVAGLPATELRIVLFGISLKLPSAFRFPLKMPFPVPFVVAPSFWLALAGRELRAALEGLGLAGSAPSI